MQANIVAGPQHLERERERERGGVPAQPFILSELAGPRLDRQRREDNDVIVVAAFLASPSGIPEAY